MTDLREKDFWLKKSQVLIKPGNKKCFALYNLDNPLWILKNIEAYRLILGTHKRKHLPNFILEKTIPKFNGDFDKLNLLEIPDEYEIIAYSLRRRPNMPSLLFILSKNGKYFVAKIGINERAKKSLVIEYNALKKFTKLHPKSIPGGVIFDFAKGSPISKNKSEDEIQLAINWLAKFHNKNKGKLNGDFSPTDVFIHNKKIEVIDWADYHKGNQLIDILGFIHKLDSNKSAEKFISQILEEDTYLEYYLMKIGKSLTHKARIKAIREFAEYNLKRNNSIFGYTVSNDSFNEDLIKILNRM